MKTSALFLLAAIEAMMADAVKLTISVDPWDCGYGPRSNEEHKVVFQRYDTNSDNYITA